MDAYLCVTIIFSGITVVKIIAECIAGTLQGTKRVPNTVFQSNTLLQPKPGKCKQPATERRLTIGALQGSTRENEVHHRF